MISSSSSSSSSVPPFQLYISFSRSRFFFGLRPNPLFAPQSRSIRPANISNSSASACTEPLTSFPPITTTKLVGVQICGAGVAAFFLRCLEFFLAFVVQSPDAAVFCASSFLPPIRSKSNPRRTSSGCFSPTNPPRSVAVRGECDSNLLDKFDRFLFLFPRLLVTSPCPSAALRRAPPVLVLVFFPL